MINLISIEDGAKRIQINMSIECLKVIINSTQIVLENITYAFRARMGYSPEEIIAFKERISKENEVDLHKSKENPSLENIINLSFEDLIIINECLNEVCNGLKIEEFENDVGLSKKLTKSLLSSINAIALQIS